MSRNASYSYTRRSLFPSPAQPLHSTHEHPSTYTTTPSIFTARAPPLTTTTTPQEPTITTHDITSPNHHMGTTATIPDPAPSPQEIPSITTATSANPPPPICPFPFCYRQFVVVRIHQWRQRLMIVATVIGIYRLSCPFPQRYHHR